MKNTLLICLLVFVSSYAAIASSALYKGLDANGNVIYSDTPFKDAERYTAPPISVVAAPDVGTDEKLEEGKSKEGEPVEFKYMAFDIASPHDKETIRNDPDIDVSLNIKPGLNTDEGHTIWLLVDDNPVVKNAQQLSLQLGRMDRGGHQLQAQIRDKDGKIVLRTKVILFFVHNTIR